MGRTKMRADTHGREVNRILGRVHVWKSSERQPTWGYIIVKGEAHGREVHGKLGGP